MYLFKWKLRGERADEAQEKFEEEATQFIETRVQGSALGRGYVACFLVAGRSERNYSSCPFVFSF